MRGLLLILLLSAGSVAAQSAQEAQPLKKPASPPQSPSKDAVFSAPFRTIPEDAVHGKIRHVQAMVVDIDGAEQMLSPGAQIRNARNNLILPIGLPGVEAERVDAKYQRDATGSVHRIWLLSEREIAALPPPPYPK